MFSKNSLRLLPYGSLLKNSRFDKTKLQLLTTQAAVKEQNDDYEMQLANAKPYSEVPKMSKFEFIRGSVPNGEFYNKSLLHVFDVLSKRHGDLFIMPGMFGKEPMLIASNPADFPIIFRNEGKWPYRKGFDFWSYHREVHRRDYYGGDDGVISTNGEKWGKVRSIINPILMQPKSIALYLDRMVDIQEDLLMRIRQVRDPATNEVPDEFEDVLNRMAFDSVAAVALNTQLGLNSKNRDSPEAKTIFECVRKFFELSYKLEILPSFWRIIQTPNFKEMMRNLDTLTDVCDKYITEAIAKLELDENGKPNSPAGEEKSVLEKMLKIDKKLAVIMAIDMMTAGVDTTTSTLFGILLCIAKHPEKQQKLFEEMQQLLPEKHSRPTMASLRNLPYLRACVKEGMRIYPIMPGTLRMNPYDIVLSGYRIPTGTHIMISANLQMLKEEYVPKAKEFIPERWLRREDGTNELAGQIDNSFMFIPFGFGPRTCAGKRMVNLEMELALAYLVRNFKIEFNHPIENAFKARFINVPNIPLKFKLEERES